MDLRVDVLVTQTYPLVAFYNPRGFAKFARFPYQFPSADNMGVPQIHLTNIAVNNALHLPHFMVDENLAQTIPFSELFDILDAQPQRTSLEAGFLNELRAEGTTPSKAIREGIETTLKRVFFAQRKLLHNRSAVDVNRFPHHFYQQVGVDLYITPAGQVKFLELNFNPVVVDGDGVNNTVSFYEALDIVGVSPPGESECVYAESEREFVEYTIATAREEKRRANVYKLLDFSKFNSYDTDDVERAVWKGL